jgi:hypothetical protein
MSKRIVYTDEPIKIGRRLGVAILPGHGGARAGAERVLADPGQKPPVDASSSGCGIDRIASMNSGVMQ